MRTSARAALLASMAGVALAACGPPRGFPDATSLDTSVDGTTGMDVVRMPDAAMDASRDGAVDAPVDSGPRDTSMDAPSPTDTIPSDVPIVDVTDVPVAETSGMCGATNLASRMGASVAMGTTSGASNHDGTCGGDMAPEAVFEWVAPAAGDYTIDTSGSGYDTVLYVRDGTCMGTEIDCNDDGSIDVTSEVAVTLTAGQRIFIFVDGFDGDSGDFVLNIN